MKAVILAGGKGKRLEPYSTILPKPLLPIGGLPILEVIIRQLKSYGLKDLVLACGYLGNLIETYFGDGKRFGVKINYNFETKPLGTVGVLPFIRELNRTFLVMNGDILTTLDFSKFLKYHKARDSLATIAVRPREMMVDFGVAEFNDLKHLVKYIEKPTLKYTVSMGIYTFEPEIVNFIPQGRKLDFPDLMNILLKKRKRISVYDSNDFWLDLGRPEDYKKGMEEFEKIKDKIFKNGV
jgi:NDP-mannose synthase